MAKMKPETRVNRLVAKIGPLYDWLVANRPSVRVIRVTPEDMALIEAFPKEAFSAGIIQKEGQFYWQGYQLKPAAGVVERESA